MKVFGYLDDGINFFVSQNNTYFGDWGNLAIIIECLIALLIVNYIFYKFGDCCVD
jgi:hypothetical protein